MPNKNIRNVNANKTKKGGEKNVEQNGAFGTRAYGLRSCMCKEDMERQTVFNGEGKCKGPFPCYSMVV